MCALVLDKKTAFIEYEPDKDYFGATFVLMKTDVDFESLTQSGDNCQIAHTLPGGKFENLHEAETEVRTINKFYPNNRIFVGTKATEDVWREQASKYRILHLVTHGLSDGEKPLYLNVLLSADADDDGLIEGREIAEMNLTAEMVVLSACETTHGRKIDGEGRSGWRGVLPLPERRRSSPADGRLIRL